MPVSTAPARPRRGWRLRLRRAAAVVGTAMLAATVASAPATVAAGADDVLREPARSPAAVGLAAPVGAAPALPVLGAEAVLAVASVSPARGSELGGTRVTIRGTGLAAVTDVLFGGVPGLDLTVVSPTEVRVTTPALEGWAGTHRVTVRTPTQAADLHTFTLTSVQTHAPVRVLTDPDVRGNDAPRCFTVPGVVGLSGSSVVALLNVTTVHPSGHGFVRVFPDVVGAGTTPWGATGNFEPHRDVATMAAVPVFTANGRLCYSTGGAEHVGLLIDLVGYTSGGAEIAARSFSERLLDTRLAGVGQLRGPVQPRRVHSVGVAGHAGVPADASAVLLTVAAVGGRTGNLRVFAEGSPVPGTSVVNYAGGVDKSNSAWVSLPASGELSFWSDSDAPVDVVLDVQGFVMPSSPYRTVTPVRVLDTRTGDAVLPVVGALTARAPLSIPLAGVGPVPADATAVVLNVTAVGPTGVGNLRVYPDTDGTGSTAPPNASWINYVPGRDVANQVVVALPPSGQVTLWSDMLAGSTHVTADVVGYVVE